MLDNTKITIVIVAYYEDIFLLDRLLTSLQRYANLNQVESIFIIYNSFPIHYPSITKVLNNFPSLSINIVMPYDLEPNVKFFHWNSQQLFKCLVSKLVTTEWYLIHDCKDYYVDNVDFFQECFDKNGKIYSRIDFSSNRSFREAFPLSLEISSILWNVDVVKHQSYHLPTVTPFFVKTEMMRSMVAELKNKFQNIFRYIFDLQITVDRFLTEFYLYSAYCMAKNELTDYVDWNHNKSFYNKIHQSKDLRIVFPDDAEEGQKFTCKGTQWVKIGLNWVEIINEV